MLDTDRYSDIPRRAGGLITIHIHIQTDRHGAGADARHVLHR